MTEKKFTVFHLSLIPIRQISFDTVEAARDEWLRSVLRAPLTIPHHGGRILHWVPSHISDELVIGLLQLQRPHAHHLSPAAGGGEISSEEWQGAYVVLDPTSHVTGQRVAVENDVVGRPASLLKSLVRYLNERPERPYEIYSEEVFSEEDFWKFCAAHGNVLRWVRFNFVTPNMWDTLGELDKDLRKSRDDVGADKVGVSFWGKNGIRALAEKIREAVTYTSRGGGEVRARSLDGKAYNSTESVKTTAIQLPAEGAVVDALKQSAQAILGSDPGVAEDGMD